MDRRTVLAFVLIFLILIASDAIMRRFFRSPDRVPASETTQETVASSPPRDMIDPTPEPPASHQAADATAAAPSVSLTPGTALQIADPAAVETRHEIRTPLYQAVISSRGPRLVSFRTFRYENDDDGPVELLPQGVDASLRGDDVVSFTGAAVDLGGVVFATDGPADLDVAAAAGPRTLTFRVRTEGDLEIRKTYTFDPDDYAIEVAMAVVAAGPRADEAARLLGMPVSTRFGWTQGIAHTEREDRVGQAAFKSFAAVGEELHVEKRSDLHKGADRVSAHYTGSVRFAALQNKYFIVAGILPQEPGQTVEGGVVLGADPDRQQLAWAVEAPLRPAASGDGAIAASRMTLYVGPQEAERLRAFGVGLERTMDMGWTLFRPLTEGTLWALDFMYRFIPNYGVVIILFSVLTKLLFYPLTRTSTESMKKMQALQPKIQEIQKKYKDNREKLSQETMKLYQKEKVNPMAGCLPMLVQMPVFIALYQALAHTIALRNTPFFLWIDDLSQPDSLFSLPISLPLLGSEFSLLPILMSASMWLQTKITPTANVGGQMALMNTLMPVIFLFMFYQMPSGLVLYWLVNNVVTIYQTWRIHQTAPRTGGVQAA